MAELLDIEHLSAAVRQHVDPSATIMTDEFRSYSGLGKEFADGHHTVTHSQKEYVRYEGYGRVYVSTNAAESWFSLLRRSFIGIHDQTSRAHLQRYCTEREFMRNNRQISDGVRMVAVIKGAEGKRLMYKTPASGDRKSQGADGRNAEALVSPCATSRISSTAPSDVTST